jgi:ABC-2 type transport system ATP-binding protein
VSEIAASVKGLVKSYGKTKAVCGVDLDVYRGEVLALLGPNGAGKTTIVEILEGFRDRDGGVVSVLGVDPSVKGEGARVWRDRIGIVLQSTNDTADLSVEETIRHFAKLYSHPRDPDEVISIVGLDEKRKSKGRELSGGQRRRLDVALGILGNPELLFLDEPTTGFDAEARRTFWELIEALRKGGTTILLTTHYLEEAEALADRVIVINRGLILDTGTPEKLGGRDLAQAVVSWKENGSSQEVKTATPTQYVRDLMSKFNGEIPELQVRRPSLEDTYLAMIDGDGK